MSNIDNRRGFLTHLAKTRESLGDALLGVFSKSDGKIAPAMFDDIEDQLILGDLGVETSREVVDNLRNEARNQRIATTSELQRALRLELTEILQGVSCPLVVPQGEATHVILLVGVNGVGKTTTAAKLAYWLRQQGRTVMFAACDTFRAAAIEQLAIWGKRLEVPVIAQHRGTDAAAVAHDALASAHSKGIDVLIIDSAGRQHVNKDLMEQLGKIYRVLSRIDPIAPHNTLLVVDAGNGQNVLAQVEAFNSTVPLTGVCVTKLDGTARGGIVVPLAHRFGIPIPFVGLGEHLEDLSEFDAEAFVLALLPNETD
jgi:fused signal recognition particle receptor